MRFSKDMKYCKDLDYFRTFLISLVILIHIVHFGDLYPATKSAILSFMMPTFLIITGFLVNIDKSVPAFLRYIGQIALPYVIFVTGFAYLSLYLPVRGGITTFDLPTIAEIIFIKSIGPYWFFHTMIVCGILYYTTFRIFHQAAVTTRYLLFATALIVVGLWTPFLNLKAAIYYFLGVGVRWLVGDFSRIYRVSLWALLPFALLVSRPDFQDWGTISTLVCVVCFLCFSSFFIPYFRGPARTAVEYVGRNTFPIYIFHPIFTMLAKFLVPLFSFDPTGLLHAFFSVAMCIAGSLWLARFMDRFRLSYLLGRPRILR